MSKAIITLEDYDGGIDVRLEFDPPASASGRIYGSQWLAGEMLKIASNILERAEQDEEQA
jgi:hypothetical protein